MPLVTRGLIFLLTSVASPAVAEPVSVDLRYAAGIFHATDETNGNDMLMSGSRIRVAQAILGVENSHDALRSRIAFDVATQARRAACESNPEIVKYVRKLARCGGELLQEAYVKRTLANGLSLKVGRDIIHQGGYSGLPERELDFFPTPYTAWHQPFDRMQSAVEMSWHGLSLQLTNDVTTAAASTGTFTRGQAQPAGVLQFHGGTYPVRPLLQTALYDLNRSYFVSIGIEMNVSDVRLTLDTTEDHRRQKFIAADGAPAPEQIFRNHTANIEAALGAHYLSYFKFARMDVRQPILQAASLTDRSHNEAGFDDNYQSLGAGLKIRDILSKNNVSIGWHQETGRFLDADDPTATEIRRWDTWYLAVNAADAI